MKKGFLVYFDNCRQTALLPDDQFALVWRAIFRYAEQVAQGREAESLLREAERGLSGEAAMALRFIASTVARDNQRYQTRTEAYRKAQSRANSSRATGSAAEMSDDAWKYV